MRCGVCRNTFQAKIKSQKYCCRACYKRAWIHNNRDKYNARMRERRRTKAAWYRQKEPLYYRTYRAKLLSSRPWSYLLQSRRAEAKNKKLAFDLTQEWAAVRWTGCCEITGIAFRSNGKRGPHPFSPSLDRIEPSKGYTQNNCRFILWGCNAIKGVGTDEDMYEIARAIARISRRGSLPDLRAQNLNTVAQTSRTKPSNLEQR